MSVSQAQRRRIQHPQQSGQSGVNGGLARGFGGPARAPLFPTMIDAPYASRRPVELAPTPASSGCTSIDHEDHEKVSAEGMLCAAGRARAERWRGRQTWEASGHHLYSTGYVCEGNESRAHTHRHRLTRIMRKCQHRGALFSSSGRRAGVFRSCRVRRRSNLQTLQP